MIYNDEADVQTFPLPPDFQIPGVDGEESSEFVIPPLENQEELLPEKIASEQAVYAVGAYPDAFSNLVEAYTNTQRELMEQGYSSVVDAAKARWKEEQDISTKQAMASILEDSSIPRELKIDMLSHYTSTGYVSGSIKDKFVQSFAAEDAALTESDRKAQDLIIANLPKRREQSISSDLKESAKSFKSYALGISAAGVEVINQIPAGLAGVFKTIWDNDYEKGERFAKEVNKDLNKFRYDNKAKDKFWKSFEQDPKAKEVYQETLGLLEKIGVPFKWVEEKLYEWTKSPRWATIGEMAAEGVAFGTASTALKAVKGTPKVKANSPADTMVDANPQLASEMFNTAIKSPDDTLAKALGTDKGSLLHDTALPKLDQVAKEYPDLHEKIINDLDVKAEYSFNLLKYDPNIIRQASREEDLDLILTVVKEQTPFYQQANSVLTSPGQGVYEGKMVFGKNANHAFSTIEEAQEAAKTIQASINKLPEEFNPELEIIRQPEGIKIAVSWRKEYDEFGALVFGPESNVRPSILGIDITKFAKSMAGPWATTRGVFDKAYEASQARSITRAAKQSADLFKIISPISKTKHGKELNRVINEMETQGKDILSKNELRNLFGDKLSETQYKELYTDMVYYRRATQYIHRIRNFTERDKLASQGFKSIYDENGKFIDNVNPKVDSEALTNAKTIYDMDDGTFKPKGQIVERDGVLVDSATGRQVVTISRENINTDFGNLALIPSKSTVGVLTDTVVPRIPGWAPRIYKDHWFVEAIPNKATMNGRDVGSKQLADFKRALASARSKPEADAIARELQATGKYGDFTINVRRERADQYQPFELDYNLNAEAFAHSRKRGEKSLRNASIEDPMVGLVKTAQATARNNTKYALDEATRQSWIKEFGDLTNNEFPTSVAQIKAGARNQPEERIQAAVAVWENYARFNNFSYATNEVWKSMLHNVADVFEKVKIPTGALRDLSRKEVPLISLPKRVATALWISLNPQRQWIVQPQHAFEFAVLSGRNAPMYMNRMVRHFSSFFGEAPVFDKTTKAAFKYLTNNKKSIDRKEFELEAQAMRDAGLLESIDTNALVHDVFYDLSTPLVPTTGQKIGSALGMATGMTAAKKLTQVGRKWGYDKGELLNQIGGWLFAKDKWIENNPGKNWNTPEAKEQIANDGFNLTGNMNKAGNLPYQQGFWSPWLQFQAIGHKNFMNILQDNATVLSKDDRIKLAMFRAIWLGGKYGLPGGGTIFKAMEWTGVSPEDRQVMENGLAEWLTRGFWEMLLDEKTDPDLAKSFSPYGQDYGLPYVEAFVHFYNLLDKDSKESPRFPATGIATSVSKLVDTFDFIFHKDYIDTEQKYLEAFQEGLKTTGGWNNAMKGAFMLAHENKLNSYGSSLDIKASTGDAIMQMFGITTKQEADQYKANAFLMEPQQIIRDLTDNIYKQISADRARNDATDEAFLKNFRSYMGAIKAMCDDEVGICTSAMYDEVVQEVINRASKDTGMESNLIRRLIDNAKYDTKSIDEAMAIMNKYEQFQPYVEAIKKGNP